MTGMALVLSRSVETRQILPMACVWILVGTGPTKMSESALTRLVPVRKVSLALLEEEDEQIAPARWKGKNNSLQRM